MIWFLFLKILFMSIGMTAAGVAVLIVSKLFAKVFSKSCIYYIWIIPLFIGILPVSGIKYQPSAEQKYIYRQSAYKREIYENTGTAAEKSDVWAGNKTADVNINKTEKADNVSKTGILPVSMKRTDFPYREVLAFLYITGVLASLLIYAVKFARFLKQIKPQLKKFDCAYEAECREKIGFGGRAEVFEADIDCSPFVYGIFRPKIVVPHGEIGAEAFMHELVHVKRRDLLYMRFVYIVKSLHFFNPFAYLFANRIKRFMELSCDECAARNMTEMQRLEYSRCIINYAAASPGTACLSETGKNIKERIDVIMTGKNHSKMSRLISAVLIAVLIFCQTALAAAINGRAPQKSYVINHTTDIYSVVYINSENGWYSGKSGLGKNQASLVNSALYKGFAADLKLDFDGEYRDGKNNGFSADMHVEMDKFIKSFYGGRHWQGLFTVTLDGETVVESAMGYLNDVPGPGTRDISRLYIESGDISFDIEHINFDLPSDAVINSAYEEDAEEYFEAPVNRFLEGSTKITYKSGGKTKTENADWLYLYIMANPKTNRLSCGEIPMAGNMFITTVPGEKYTFSGDTAEGKFLLKISGNIKADEFEGKLSGFSGKNIKFESKDKTISVKMNVKDRNSDGSETLLLRKNSVGLRNGFEDGSDFAKTCINSMHARRLSDIPFTLSLSDDKTKVILKLKDGFNPDGWYYSYSSYTNSDKDVYAKYSSKHSDGATELPLCEVAGSSHNLQFDYYAANPYVRFSKIDIMFRIVDGEIFYRCCNEYVTSNKNYSGAEGAEMLERYLLNSEKYMFEKQ